MPEPADLLKAWEQVIGRLRGAAQAADDSELARLLVAPVQRQAELLQQVLDRQLAFEREVAGRLTAPATVALDLVDQSVAAMRAQAKALDAAAVSFKQAAELMEVQAGLLERATASLRDPLGVLRSAGGAVVRRAGGDAPET